MTECWFCDNPVFGKERIRSKLTGVRHCRSPKCGAYYRQLIGATRRDPGILDLLSPQEGLH